MNLRRLFATGLFAAALAACGDDGSSGTIQLIAPEPATEATELMIVAQRTGGSDGAVSVTFSTTPGSATEDADYSAVTGTVEWADGDTEDKVVVIPILEDFIIEQAEDLVVELGEPSGGADLGTGSVTVTIADDDHVGDSIAVTSTGRLLTFDRATPTRFTYVVDLSGIGAGETVVGLDVRPADGKTYALTSAGKLYTLDAATGVATLVSTLAADPADTTMPFTALAGTDIGMDFNPVADRLRVTSTSGQNLRINVDTGATTTDTAINGLSMGYSAIAYNNNIAAACRTTLYAIDVATNRFLSQNPPNDGLANGLGGLGLDATASGGFDVYTDAAGVTSALALLTVGGASGFYSIDIGSGAATAIANPPGLDPNETVIAFASAALPPTTPATQQAGELYGATATSVVSFNRAAPAKLCGSQPFNGLGNGDTVVGIDMRPSTGVLYVLVKNGTAGRLHRVDATTGNLSPAIPVAVALQGTEFGMDFNPTGPVALRIVSNTGQNIRVTDLTTGAATADTPLNGAGTTAVGAAYTDAIPGAGTTTLYVLDAAADRLRVQNPPNAGVLTDVGPLGVDVSDVSGFDIDGRDNAAILVVSAGTSSTLHSLDLTTGTVSASLGTIGGGAALVGVTRATPQTNVYGVTSENKLVRISLTDPSMVTVISDPMLMPPVDTITGLSAGETLVGIDVRPGSNVMYGVGSLGGVYTVNSSTASANKQGTLAADPTDTSNPFTALSGTSFGVDFNPTGAVPMRVVSDAEQNLRIPNVSTPLAVTDGPLSPGPVNVTAAAYTNSFVPPAGVTPGTTLYVIDVTSGSLMIQNPPNNGTLTPVGVLGAGAFSDPTTPTHSGFDIAGGNNGIALAALQRPTATPGVLETFSRLYRIDLTTGAATEIGTGIGGAPLRGLAIQVR